MKYLIHFLLFTGLAALLFILHRYGISTFITTLLVYYFLYLGLYTLLGLVPSAGKRELLRGNLRSLTMLFLGLEFALTFILGLMNTPMEKERFLYLSEYKRAEQCTLFLSLGVDQARFVFTDCYLPGFKRVIRKKDYTYTHHYNAAGLRGPLPPLAKDSNEFRIVLLGDSFAEGEGAPDDSTIAVRLQRHLELKYPDRRICVINGGIAGSSPVYEQTLYFKHLQTYQPDLVIQTWYANDLFDINVMLHSGKLPTMEYAWAISHIYRILYIQFINPEYVLYGYSEKPAKENREFLMGYLREKTDSFRQALQAQGTELLTAYIPARDELIDDDLTFTAQLTETDWSKLSDMNFYNILPDAFNPKLDSRDLVDRLYWSHDAHLRPVGYDFVAQKLATRIVSRIIPSIPSAGPAPADNGRPSSGKKY